MHFLNQTTLHPVFDPEEFEKLRSQSLTQLAVKQQSPEYQAGREFRKRLYGEHPYARTVEGEVEDIKNSCRMIRRSIGRILPGRRMRC